MIPRRISLKFYATGAESVELDALIPIFHRWIQRHTLEGHLLDVADYKHVVDGPGILLIGHETDYAYDLSEGRPGLLVTRKRDLHDTLADALSDIFRLTIATARKLSAEKSLDGLKFDFSEARIAFLDRLSAPNTPETFEAVREDLRAFLADFYGVEDLSLEVAYDDPREPFAVRVRVPEPVLIESKLAT